MARRSFLARIIPIQRRPGHPDQGLPDPEHPVDPGYGVGEEHPDQGLPPEVGVWPPVPGRPDLPIVLPPPEIWPPTPQPPPIVWPPKIDNTLPPPPHGIWPPPGAPDNTLPPTAGNLPVFPGSPGEPGTIWPPLPVHPPHPDQGLPGGDNSTCLVIVWVPGVGYRWVVVDLSIRVEHPISGGPGAQPK
jgi:hypothetical protein